MQDTGGHRKTLNSFTPAALRGLILLLPALSSAGELDDGIFQTRFTEVIQPQIPLVDGVFQLPEFPPSPRLDWILSELVEGETTTLSEIESQFEPVFDFNNLVDFFNDTLRVDFPNARIVDVIGVSAQRANVVVEGDNPDFGPAYFNVGVVYAGDQKTNFFSVVPFSGTIQFPSDQTRTLIEAVDHFQTISASNSLFIGRIDTNNQCEAVYERQADTPRGIGSIFKTWILGALAERINQGQSDLTDLIPLAASDLAAGGIINNEPLGTLFSVRDMAVLMMVNSDNTSTDHLHELVGRDAVADVLGNYGVVETDQLLPFLNISEQFHVFTRFDLPTAQSYVNGSLNFREQFLDTEILPEGPSFPINFPFFHSELLANGTWSASARDICRTFAGLRTLPLNSPGFEIVDQALGLQASQPGIRNQWERVWFKGGSLTSGATGNHVFASAWLLQQDGASKPWVVVALANDDAGGISAGQVRSVTSRIIELIGDS